VRDWYPVNRWVDVSDGERGVTVAPLDAPMVQMGGITTGLWAKHLDPDGPNLMSWALNNHWMVNFKASQGGEIPLRYRLTTHDGGCDDLAAGKFGAEQATPVIAMRDVAPVDARTGQFATIEPGAVELIHLKPADWGEGIILRLQNIHESAATALISFVAATPTSAALITPDEIDGEEAALDGNRLKVNVPAKTVQSVRVRF
jgi:alpha-mannosidase